MRIRFGDDDRARLSLPDEWIDYDPKKISVKDSILIQKAIGLKPAEFGKALRDGDGEALCAWYWLVARKGGSTATYDEFDFDLGELQHEDEAQVTPGKDPSTPETTSET